jgi:hypothetical protein
MYPGACAEAGSSESIAAIKGSRPCERTRTSADHMFSRIAGDFARIVGMADNRQGEARLSTGGRHNCG